MDRMRKSFNPSEILFTISKLQNSNITLITKESKLSISAKMETIDNSIQLNLTDSEYEKIQRLGHEISSSSVFYIYENNKELVMKVLFSHFIFDRKKILFPIPSFALLEERRNCIRRSVINSFGYLLNSDEKLRVKIIDFHENGSRIRINIAQLENTKILKEISSKKDLFISFKDFNRRYKMKVINNTSDDKYYYLGLKFYEPVYLKMNFLPLHLENL